jgi:hypothetical protein
MKRFVQNILRDKEGQYNIREVVTLLFVLALLVSWVAEQFCGIPVPEYMFYSFTSLIGAGCFGYSIERKSITHTKKQNQRHVED